MRNLDRHILVYTVGGNAATSIAHNVPPHGITALESVGIEADSRNQNLKRRLTTRLKSLLLRRSNT